MCVSVCVCTCKSTSMVLTRISADVGSPCFLTMIYIYCDTYLFAFYNTIIFGELVHTALKKNDRKSQDVP